MKINRFNYRKKLVLIISVFVGILILFGGSLYLSINIADTSAKNSISDVRQSVIDKTADINSKLADNNLSIIDKRDELSNYASTLKDTIDSVCENQQKLIYFALGKEKTHCEEVAKSLTALDDSVNRIVDYFAGDVSLSLVFADLQPDLSLEASYSQWSKVYDDLSSVQVSDDLGVAKTALATAVMSYRDNWKALVDADAAKDSDAFTSAQNSLLTTYSGISSASDELKNGLSILNDIFKADFNEFMSKSKS